MLLNDLELKVLQPFVSETLKIMENSLGLQGEAENFFKENVKRFKFKGYAIVANTTGSITGRVLIHHYTETAIEIGTKLLQKQNPNYQPTEKIDDGISNALADFSLSIIESSMNILQNSELDIRFSQTYFISNTEKMESLLEDVKEIMTVPIRIEQIGRFYLNYLVH